MRHNLAILERTLKNLASDLSQPPSAATVHRLFSQHLFSFYPVTEIGLLFISYVRRIKTRSINQLQSADSKQSPIPMIWRHAKRNRKTGTQLPSVNFNSQENNPLLELGARTAEGTAWHLARSLTLHGTAHQHAEVTIPSAQSQRECAPASQLL